MNLFSQFNFTRKIKLFFYKLNKHFTLAEFNLFPPEGVRSVGGSTPTIIPLQNINTDLFEIVENHTSADFIVFPLTLFSLIHRSGIFGDAEIFKNMNNPDGNSKVVNFLRGLPYFDKYEERHLFFTCHDWNGPYGVNCTVINQSVSKQNNNPNMICVPHFVEDMNYTSEDNRIIYCTNFIGYVHSHQIRGELVKSLILYHKAGGRLPICVNTNSAFFEHMSQEEQDKRRRYFLDCMYKSTTSLCPRGTGFNSMRFFETMSMGRIPILISDNCVLPLEDLIRWESCILRIAEDDVSNIGDIMENYMSKIDNNDIMRLFINNRITWEEFFQPSHAQFVYYTELSRVLSSL